jgi:hypothetical protein
MLVRESGSAALYYETDNATAWQGRAGKQWTGLETNSSGAWRRLTFEVAAEPGGNMAAPRKGDR